MAKLSLLFIALVLCAAVCASPSIPDETEDEVDARSPDALLEEENQIRDSERAKMEPLAIAALTCHAFAAGAKVVSFGLDYLSKVLNSKYIKGILASLAAVPDHLASRQTSHQKIVDAISKELANLPSITDKTVSTAIATQDQKLKALDTAAKQSASTAEAEKIKAEEVAKQMLELGKLAIDTVEQVVKVSSVGVEAPSFMTHLAAITGQSWLGAAPFGFIGPLTSSVGGLVTLAKSISNLKSMRDKCKAAAGMIVAEIDVFKMDVDWNFCRSYSFMLDGWSAAIKTVKAQLAKTPTDAAAKSTLATLGKMVSIVNTATFAKGGEFDCNRFTTKPKSLTDTTPITELWVEPRDRFDSNPKYNDGASVYKFAVTNQPSVIMNKKVTQYTTVYADKHTGDTDPFIAYLKKNPSEQKRVKCQNVFNTHHDFAPIDTLGSKYVTPDHRIMNGPSQQIEYAHDFMSTGPLAISAIQPIVNYRECARLRDFCLSNTQHTGGPCNNLQKHDDGRQPGLYPTDDDNLSWQNFVPASETRALVPDVVSPTHAPGLMLMYQRSGFRAPIVDLYSGVGDSRDLGTPATSDWWFPIPAVLDKDTAGCPDKFVNGWYRKNFYIAPITIEDATIPSSTPSTPTKTTSPSITITPAKTATKKFAARRMNSKPLLPKTKW